MAMSDGASKMLKRLNASYVWSQERLRPFRDQRVRMLQEISGSRYGENRLQREVPVNLLDLAASIYQRQLAAADPRLLVTTNISKLNPSAYEFEIRMNQLLEEIVWSMTQRVATYDSLFGLGVVKCGITSSKADELEGFLYDAGQPYATHVQLDDFSVDMAAQSWNEVQWMGNCYRLPIDRMEDSGLYDSGVMKLIKDNAYERRSDERAEYLSSGSYVPERLEDVAMVWDIWLPRDNKVLTLASDGYEFIGGKPLREIEWEGAEQGPFHVLALNTIPGNLMPSPPMDTIYDLHMAQNSAVRKLIRQQDRQKTVTAYRGEAVKDGENLQGASDGDVIQMNQPDSIVQYSSGGIDQQSLGFLHSLRDMSNYYAGNLDSMGGLGASSPTATQDQMMQDTASQRIRDYQGRVSEWTRGIMRALGRYVWENPSDSTELSMKIPGSDGRSMQFKFNSGPNKDFPKYSLKIDPYSLTDITPAQRAARIEKIVAELLIPLQPQMEQQGLQIDVKNLIQNLGRYSQVNELGNIVTEAEQGPIGTYGDTGGGTQKPNRPVNTKHTSERTTAPGPTRAGEDQTIASVLGGRGEQGASGVQAPMVGGS